MAGSAEYGVLVRHTGDLNLAVRANLTSLGANLFGAEIITTDQYDDIRITQRSVNDRAADLVRYVQDKVRQNRQHYYAFIGALKEDESEYRDILAKLEESLKKGPQSREGGNRQPIPTVPAGGVDAPADVTFDSSMSDEDFFKWLRSRGISDKDCKTLSENGVTPSGILLFRAEDFDDMGLTVVGKKLFLKTFEEIKGLVQRIETLETKFSGLYQKLVSEVIKKRLAVSEFYQALALLPITFRKEYESSIQQTLPAVKDRDDCNVSVVTSSIFLLFSPLFVFIDYDLLNHMISKFGSAKLKSEMAVYIKDVKVFMRETTVGDLIDHWPGCEVSDLNYTKLKAKFKDDPKTYTLERLNKFRRKFCGHVRLSEFIFCLISLESSESFFATWIIPNTVIPELIEAIQQVDESFYEEEHIISLFINEKQLYPSTANSSQNEVTSASATELLGAKYPQVRESIVAGQRHQQQDTFEGSRDWHTITQGKGQQHKTLPSLQQLASGVLEMIKTTSPVAMGSNIGQRHQQQDTYDGSSDWHTIIQGTGQQHSKTTSPVAMGSTSGQRHQPQDTFEGLSDWHTITQGTGQQHSKTTSPVAMGSTSETQESSISLDSTPKLHQLDLLECHGKSLRLIRCIAYRWNYFAYRGLHFKRYIIEAIEHSCHHQADQACKTMLIEWLNGEARRPISWRTLITALKESDLSEVAHYLEELIKSI